MTPCHMTFTSILFLSNFAHVLFVCLFETESHYLALVGLELTEVSEVVPALCHRHLQITGIMGGNYLYKLTM